MNIVSPLLFFFFFDNSEMNNYYSLGYSDGLQDGVEKKPKNHRLPDKKKTDSELDPNAEYKKGYEEGYNKGLNSENDLPPLRLNKPEREILLETRAIENPQENPSFEKIKQLVGNNKTIEAINLSVKMFEENKHKNETAICLAMSARVRNLQDEKIAGLISREDYNIEMNDIHIRLLKITEPQE